MGKSGVSIPGITLYGKTTVGKKVALLLLCGNQKSGHMQRHYIYLQ